MGWKAQFICAVVSLFGFLTNSVFAAPTLVWDANPEPDIAGYAVYYSDLTAGSSGRWDAGSRHDLPLDLEGGHEYTFRVTAYNQAGLESEPSPTLSYTAPPDPAPPDAPSITSQPVSQTVVLGGAFTVDVSVTGAAPLSYQWLKNGTPISGATSSSYSISSVLATNAGSYTVRVSNAAGSVTSSAAVLTVIGLPSISTQPLSQTVAIGSSVSFSVTATGDGTLSYQWLRNGTQISGATSSSYSISSVQGTNAGSYTVRVSNAAGSVTSAAAVLTVIGLPSITGQPLSRTVNTGSTVTFTVTATTSNGTLSYQWLKDGVEIVGATLSSYSISSVQGTNAGSYTVRVSNIAGSVTSSAATLTVISPPTISTQPLSQTVNIGSAVTFSVTATTGNGTLSYRWFKNGTQISGATSSSYSINSVQATSAGSFTVRVSNAAGNVTSSAAVLTVISLPTISTQPLSQTVAAGSAVTFSVTATTGNGTLSYQWLKNGTQVSGAISSSYSVSSVQETDAGSYAVRVSNAAGSVTSAGAVLTVLGLPGISTQPLSQTVNVGAPVTFSITAAGSGTLGYQWLKNGTQISGATSSSYSINSVQETDAGSYAVRVSNSAGSVTSSMAVLAVITPPTISVQPVSQSVRPGSPFSLFVEVQGTAPLTYRWYKDGQIIPIPIALSSYEVAAASEQDAGSYLVEVSNAAGTVTSAAAVLTVADVASISTQPLSQTVNVGASVTFSVTATGTGTLSYQWFKNGVEIPGATSSSYSISSAQKTDAASYTVRVANAAGSAVSSAAVLTVISPPSISEQPASQTVTIGSAITFSVTATTGNGTLTYQWFKNGVEISGATSSSYSIGSAAETDAASYTVRLSNAAGTVTSLEAILTVITAPAISAQPLSQTVNAGSPVTFSVTATTGNGTLGYQWLKNGVEISGATAASYLIGSAQEVDAASYAVRVSNAAGSVTSSAAILTVITPPTISVQPLSESVKVGAPFELFVEVLGTAPLTYRWFKDGQFIPGAAESSYEVSAATEQDAGSYSVEVSNAAGRVVSEIAVITTEVVETRLDLTFSEASANTLQLTLSGEPGTYEVRQCTDLGGNWTSIISTNISGPTQISIPLGSGQLGFFRMVRVQN